MEVGFLFRWLGSVLEIFQQKAFVFVDVRFGLDKPYCITVINRSRFSVLLNEIIIDPDGFPDEGNGWFFNGTKLFSKRPLKPGQKIQVFLTGEQMGNVARRKFTIKYGTYVFGKLVPRYKQESIFNFDKDMHTISVQKTISVS